MISKMVDENGSGFVERRVPGMCVDIRGLQLTNGVDFGSARRNRCLLPDMIANIFERGDKGGANNGGAAILASA